MSFGNNPATRGQLKGWFRLHGHNRAEVLADGRVTIPSSGRSLAGKIYLPVEPATNPEERAGATNADSSDSKLTPPAAPAGGDQFPPA